jgi:hypothetical protein
MVSKSMGVGGGVPVPMPPGATTHVGQEIGYVMSRGSWEGGSQFALAAELKGRSLLIEAADGTIDLDSIASVVGLIPGGKALFKKVSGPVKRVISATKKVTKLVTRTRAIVKAIRKNPRKFVGRVLHVAKKKLTRGFAIAKAKAFVVGAIIDSGVGLVTFTTSMVAIDMIVKDPTTKVNMLNDLKTSAERGEHGYALQTGFNLQDGASDPKHLQDMRDGKYGAGGQSQAAMIDAHRGHWSQAGQDTVHSGETAAVNQAKDIREEVVGF